MGKRFWITLLLFVAACQKAETAGTSVEMLQTALPSPSATISLPPLPTLAPSPIPPTASPSPTVTITPQPSLTFTPSPSPSTPYPEEWLTFVIRDFHTSYKPRVFNLFSAYTAISFANYDGSELLQPELVDPREISFEWSLAWSSDGRYLLFDGSNTPELIVVPQLYLADLLAVTIRKTTSGQEYGSAYGSPSWAPDQLKFVNTLDTPITTSEGKKQIVPNIVATDAGALSRKRLTTGPFSDLYPSWSPDGQWIAYLRYTSPGSPCSQAIPTNYGGCNKADLYLVSPGGGEPRLLLESVYVQSDRDGRDSVYNAPAWSPDSRWLAVLVGEHQPDIALVDVETGTTRLLADHPAQDLYPTWSPDGSWLAFVSDREGNEEIYLVASDGGELTNLTHNPASDFNPVWSPSGRFIAFLSDREEAGAYKLYVMNADGSDQKKLHDGYVFTRPAWFPRLDVDLRDFIKQ